MFFLNVFYYCHFCLIDVSYVFVLFLYKTKSSTVTCTLLTPKVKDLKKEKERKKNP